MSRECCPSGSWGHLAPDSEYEEKGVVVTLARDLPVYRVGEAKDGRCIVWNYDIHGFNGGRTRQLCDWIAEKGYLVLLPDYFRGDMLNMSKEADRVGEFGRKHTQWDNLRKDFEECVVPCANKHGATVFGVIGTCWGTYPVLRQSTFPCVKAGVSMHPSHSRIAGLLGINEEDFLREVNCPQLFMPAGNDHENTKAGGLADQIFNGDGKHLLDIVEFPEMTHGWTCRGDITDDKVKADVIKAITLAVEFFDKHVH